MKKQKKGNKILLKIKSKIKSYKGIIKQLSYPDRKTMLQSTAIVVLGSVLLSAIISLETAGVAELVKVVFF